MCNYHDNYINFERVREAYSQLTHTFTNTKKNNQYISKLEQYPNPFLYYPFIKSDIFLFPERELNVQPSW